MILSVEILAEELSPAPGGGTGRNFAEAKLLLVHAAWGLNPLAGINIPFVLT
jgi:hypothetical protein